MSNLAAIIEQESGRGQMENKTKGLPSLDLTDMQGIEIPTEYEITGVLGDIMMCEVADESENGEVMRGGIWLKQEVVTKMWRVAKIIIRGPQCSDATKVGDYVMYPSDKGIPMVNNGKKMLFLNEERIFCVCKPTKQ